MDTNCYFFLRSASHVLPVWSSIPREVSIVGDRLFYKAVKANSLGSDIAAAENCKLHLYVGVDQLDWASRRQMERSPIPITNGPTLDSRTLRQRARVTNRLIQTKLEVSILYGKVESTPPRASTGMSGPPKTLLASSRHRGPADLAAQMATRGPQLWTAKKVPPIPRRQKICLSMIVKNEASVIRRCLESVRPLIDYWIIVDTGSVDGTQDIIREFFQDIPGELHERPWVDFAHNRSEALALARNHGDYSLIIDADDVLELPPGFRLPFLKKTPSRSKSAIRDAVCCAHSSSGIPCRGAMRVSYMSSSVASIRMAGECSPKTAARKGSPGLKSS